MSVPPLTTVLHRVGWSDSLLPAREGRYTPFSTVVENAFNVLRKKDVMQKFLVDQTGITLFGAIPNSYLRHITRGHNFLYGPSGNGWSYAVQLTPAFRRFLLRKLFWFAGLKQVHKDRMYSLCETTKGFQRLSNMMQTAEGRVIAALLSVGDQLTYEQIDALNVSIISNLLNDSRFMKKMKTYLKQVRQSYLTGAPIRAPPRNLSFLWHIIKKCTEGIVDPDEGAYRIATFCQGRAMGNPTGPMIRDSAQKWVENITKPDPKRVEDYNLEELEVALAQTRASEDILFAHARISLSTSARLEASRENGGGLAVAKDILDLPSVRKIDLETGQDSDQVVVSRDNPGEALFHYSLWKMRDSFQDSMTVRASNVNEGGGKSRVITAGSFYHGAVLSPWAHIWLKLLSKFPAARAGVQEGRHGWAFVKSITASRPDMAWIFEQPVKAVSTDLSEATDHLNKSAARALIRMCHRVLEVPTWYGQLVESCLCDNRYVDYRAGSFTWTGEATNGVFMGDSGCKVLLTLGNLLAVMRMANSGLSVSAVVGDDHTSICSDAETALEIYKRTVRSFGFVTSDDDEVISSRYGFYAEELYKVPQSNRATVDALYGTSKELPYIDVPKVRLLMDIRKDRADFASTCEGRIFQFGKELEYVNRPNRFQGLFHIGSWIQDLCLDLRHKPEFVYFPRSLVGGGKPLLFRNGDNFRDFVRIHKGGRLESRYHFVMDLAVQNKMNFGIIPRFFTKTNEHRLLVVKQRALPEAVAPLVLFQSRKKQWYKPLVIQRIRDYVISETEILSRLNQLEQLFSEVPVAVPATVENVATGHIKPDAARISSFLNLWEGNSMLLGSAAQENYYPREEVMRILDLENPLHVPLPIKWRGKEGGIPAERMLERERDAVALYEWVLRTSEDENPPTEIIADDPVIVDSIRDILNQDIYIVTADIAMARYASSVYWKKRIHVISPRRWIQAGSTARPLFSTEVQDQIIVDLGSVDNYIATLSDEEIDEIVETVVPLEYADIRYIRATTAVEPKEIRESDLLYKLSQAESFIE